MTRNGSARMASGAFDHSTACSQKESHSRPREALAVDHMEVGGQPLQLRQFRSRQATADSDRGRATCMPEQAAQDGNMRSTAVNRLLCRPG